MDIVVRVPNPDDAIRMAEVHIAAWRHAYAGVMPDDFLAGLDHGRLTANWRRDLANPPDGTTNMVGELDGRIEAISVVGPFRDRADDDDPDGELWMINCHPDAFGSGVATEVHRWALQQLGRDGHRRAALWVVEQNPRARRFYQREGWELDDQTKTDEFGDRTIVEVRYSITLG